MTDHAQIVGKLPALKFDTDAIFSDITARVDELAACPAGHDKASHLSQQIKSSIDAIRSRVAELIPQDEEPRPVVGEPVEEEVEHEPEHPVDEHHDIEGEHDPIV